MLELMTTAENFQEGNMAHKCARCGNISFDNFNEYKLHLKVMHGIKEEVPVVNRSGKPRTQVIKEAEGSWMKKYLIEGELPKIQEREEVAKARVVLAKAREMLEQFGADSPQAGDLNQMIEECKQIIRGAK